MKLLEKLKHRWKLLTSEEYRTQENIKEGEKIWKRLDRLLPPAEGVTSKDRVRLKAFRKMLLGTTPKERLQLKAWLVYQIKELRDNFAEFSSPKIEDIERQHWQIYSEHLDVLMLYK